jgi:Peptidase inhibitor family I36
MSFRARTTSPPRTRAVLRIAVLASSAMLAVGGLASSASAAQAHAAHRLALSIHLKATAEGSPQALSSCGSGDFCAWSGENYTGSFKAWYKCQTTSGSPFSGDGSYYNHQTGGAVTTIYRIDDNGKPVPPITVPAGAKGSINWHYVSGIKIC